MNCIHYANSLYESKIVRTRDICSWPTITRENSFQENGSRPLKKYTNDKDLCNKILIFQYYRIKMISTLLDILLIYTLLEYFRLALLSI